MYIRGFKKKIFFICFLLSHSIAHANWESLYEEYEYSDNKNLYLYPIDVNVSYSANFSTGFKSIDKSIQKDDKREVLLNLDSTQKRNIRSFFNHGFRLDVGIMMTGYGFAKKFYCFPRFGLIYQHLLFNMKLKDNGTIDDILFYFSPVSSPTATFEVAPRLGIGVSFLCIPREFYSKLEKEENGTDENGNTIWKLNNDDPIDFYLYNGADLALSYDLIFKLRFVPEWTIFATIGGVWRPLLFKQGVFEGKVESSFEKNSFENKILDSLKIIEGGIGTIGATLGFNYNFQPALERPEWYNKFLRRNDNKVRFKFELLGGGRNRYGMVDINEDGTNKKVRTITKSAFEGIIGGDFKTLLQFNNFQALGFGVGGIVDFARKNEIFHLDDELEYVNIHAGCVHEFIYNRLILENFLGINIKKGDKIGPGPEASNTILGRFFWHPSLCVKLSDIFFIGVGAHVGILAAPWENDQANNISMETLKNNNDFLKFEYLNLSLGIDWVLDPVSEYYD